MLKKIVLCVLFCLLVDNLYASVLEEDLIFLLSDSPTMDYNDARLNRVLARQDLNIFKYYKAFIEYDKSKHTSEDLAKAKKVFLEAEKNEVLKYSSFSYPSSRYIHFHPMDAFLAVLASPEMYLNMQLCLEELNKASDYVKSNVEGSIEKVPLWLVLKHPTILQHNNERFSPLVNAEHSVEDLIEFQNMQSTLYRMMAEHWSAPHGSIIRDVAAYNKNFVEKISFAPSLIVSMPHFSRNENIIYTWSSEGLWNRLVYKRFEKEFALASSALKDYYKKYYNFEEYAQYAESILAKYAGTVLSSPIEENYTVSLAMNKSNKDDIKGYFTGRFNQKNKNEFLCRAILLDYDKSLIEWMLQNGADVNASFLDETPLMRAANNPEMLKLLLAYNANIAGKNAFGKTALFYAIQFGSIDCVKLLLDAGANVNHALNPSPKKELKTQDQGDRYASYSPITKIYSFTPLIYAKRYADKSVVRLLLKHGAKMGEADPKIVKEWVKEGKLDL